MFVRLNASFKCSSRYGRQPGNTDHVVRILSRTAELEDNEQLHTCPYWSCAHGNGMNIFSICTRQMYIVAWIWSTYSQQRAVSCVSVHMTCNATSNLLSPTLFSILFQTWHFNINPLSESLGVFNTNTLSSVHVYVCPNVCFLVFVHTETCISEFVCVCVCACLQFLGLGKRLPKETNKHISHCAHMVTREQNKKEMEGETGSLGEGMQTDAQGWRERRSEERKQGHIRLSSWISAHRVNGSQLSCSTL